MSAEMYPRPSREEIAARVQSQPAATANADDLDDVATRREPEPQGTAVANFAVHLRARMRALGWDSRTLAQKTGLTQVTVTRAAGGTATGLDIAEKLAAAVSGYLAAMIGPYLCGTCHGEPPPGFSCLECSAETRAA